MSTEKRALVTGITGQDGSYLAELLLGKGYVVHGVVRRASTFNTTRLDHLYRDPHEPNRRLILHYGDLLDASFWDRALRDICPDEVYHLGAQSHVKVSFENPVYTADVVALGTLRVLEACRDYVRREGRCLKIYNAATSEMFGSAPPPQSEATPFRPRSPYAVSKTAAYWYAVNYREAYGLFAVNGILFNHESPRRGETFVTRKITRAVGRIKCGTQRTLYLGNLDARRDWGYAGDHVEAMWRMLQHNTPADFVVATGTSHSVAEFADLAFRAAGLDWRDHVRVDEQYFRPSEVDHLLGDASKAAGVLGWRPSMGFEELVRSMVEADVQLAQREATSYQQGVAAR